MKLTTKTANILKDLRKATKLINKDNIYPCWCREPNARVCFRHNKLWMNNEEQKYFQELAKKRSKIQIKEFNYHIKKFCGVPIVVSEELK